MAGIRKDEKDPVLEILERRRKQILFLREKLLDEKTTTFGVVTTSNSLPVEIAKRTIKELEASGIKVNLVVVNKCRKNCEEIGKVFRKKVITVELLENEPTGVETLKKVGSSILKELSLP
jgi:arsenite-transporting ATPase